MSTPHSLLSPAQPSESGNGVTPVKDRFKALVELHSQKDGKKITVTHPGFSALQEEGRRIIESILTDTYRRDFEILRIAFDEKLELYLRTTSSILTEADCEDRELRAEITGIRQAISEALQGKTLTDEDIEWLNQIGFTRADVVSLYGRCDLPGVIAELKQYADQYLVILGDKKYIKKILNMPDGLRKLKALRSFSPATTFNGYHLSRIVLGAGWEEKLRYFEDPAKLKSLTDAGFEASHLSQLVRNAGWEEKLCYFEDPAKLKTFTDAGFNGYHLSQMVRNAGWEEKLRYFEDSAKLKAFTDAGFNGSHLSQIVRIAGWKEKLRYFEDSAKLKAFTDAGFNGSHLSQIVLGADWEEKFDFVLCSQTVQNALKEGRITHNELVKKMKKRMWRALMQVIR